MVRAEIDMRQLSREIGRVSADFGEANETAIARWGVAVCRELIIETQAWGDSKSSKDKQQGAIARDMMRCIQPVSKISEGRVMSKTMKRDIPVLKTPQEVIAWVNKWRKGTRKRVPMINQRYKAIAKMPTMKAAMKIKMKSVWRGKGGWVGAGKQIGRFQKGRGRLTIGKNFAGAAHKWSGGGTARMKKNVWTPEGEIVNNVSYVATSYVLGGAVSERALMNGGRKTLAWYERTMQARLNKRKR